MLQHQHQSSQVRALVLFAPRPGRYRCTHSLDRHAHMLGQLQVTACLFGVTCMPCIDILDGLCRSCRAHT